MNRIVAALSRWLEPNDRECVCGDVEELRLSSPAAAANILGLVIRRQLAEWSAGGPWVALLGVAGLAGFCLSGSLAGVETEIWIQIRTYLHYGVAYEPGGVRVDQEITYAITATLAMLLWSWACGFVLAALSGRTFWITSFLFYGVVRESWAVRSVLSGHLFWKHGLGATMLFRLLPLEPVLIAFLLALVWGTRVARKGTLSRNARWCFTAIELTLAFLSVWMEGWFAAGYAQWSGQPYHPTSFVYRVWPLLAGIWPVFSIPFLQNRQPKPGQRAA